MLIELFLRVSLVGAAFAFVSSPQPTPNAPTHESLHACEDSAVVAEVEVRGPAFEFAIDAANRFVLGDMKCPVVENVPDVVPRF